MNETVKAALLAERREAIFDLREREIEVGHAQRRLTTAEDRVPAARSRLADIESHLRDNGVDLAAVDAEAEKARDEVQSVTARNGLLSQYGQSRSSLGNHIQQYADQLNRSNTFDPTAGLANALDEA